MITGLTHTKLVSLTSPCCSGWAAPMNNPRGLFSSWLASRDLRYSALQLLGESGACGQDYLLVGVKRLRALPTRVNYITCIHEACEDEEGRMWAVTSEMWRKQVAWWLAGSLNSSTRYCDTCHAHTHIQVYEDFGARSRYLRQGWVIASHSILWDAIAMPGTLRHLLMAPKSSYVCSLCSFLLHTYINRYIYIYLYTISSRQLGV